MAGSLKTHLIVKKNKRPTNYNRVTIMRELVLGTILK